MGKYSGLNLDEVGYVEFINRIDYYEVEKKAPYLKLLNNALNNIQNDKYDRKYVIYDDADDNDLKEGRHYYEVVKIIKGLGDKYFMDSIQDDENCFCYEGDITECTCIILSFGIFDSWEDAKPVYLDLIGGE